MHSFWSVFDLWIKCLKVTKAKNYRISLLTFISKLWPLYCWPWQQCFSFTLLVWFFSLIVWAWVWQKYAAVEGKVLRCSVWEKVFVPLFYLLLYFAYLSHLDDSYHKANFSNTQRWQFVELTDWWSDIFLQGFMVEHRIHTSISYSKFSKSEVTKQPWPLYHHPHVWLV